MRKALVVGASSGIGRELTRVLVADGWEVAAMARRTDLLQELRTELQGNLQIRELDVCDTASSAAGFHEAVAQLGGADLVVLCAGTGDLNPELEWEKEEPTIRTNVLGFAVLATEAMGFFLRQGSGHLVGIGSVAGLRGSGAAPSYAASKAFVSNYLEGLRQKAVKEGVPVTVTEIRPGFVQTAMAKGEGLFWVAPVEKAVLQLYAAIKARKRCAYVTRRWRLIGWLLTVLPGFVYERL